MKTDALNTVLDMLRSDNIGKQIDFLREWHKDRIAEREKPIEGLIYDDIAQGLRKEYKHLKEFDYWCRQKFIFRKEKCFEQLIDSNRTELDRIKADYRNLQDSTPGYKQPERHPRVQVRFR